VATEAEVDELCFRSSTNMDTPRERLSYNYHLCPRLSTTAESPAARLPVLTEVSRRVIAFQSPKVNQLVNDQEHEIVRGVGLRLIAPQREQSRAPLFGHRLGA